MEQSNQEITPKVLFPIKTRIIGVLMLLIGCVGLILSIFLFYSLVTFTDSSYKGPYIYGGLLLATPVAIVFGIIFFFSGLLILRKKKLGWWLAIIIFSIITAIVFFAVNVMYIHFLFNLIISLISLIPLIILLRDRKNFFKIAS